MNMIKADKENNIFGALKLIEQLYLDGEIPGYVFRNILQEYKDDVCIADFTCYKRKSRKVRVSNVWIKFRFSKERCCYIRSCIDGARSTAFSSR